MLPAGFEPTISAGERPQTYALDRAATGTSFDFLYDFDKISHSKKNSARYQKCTHVIV